MSDIAKQKFYWVPQDWNLKQLKDIVTEARLGGNYSNSESGKGLPLIKMGNLGRGRISLNKVEYVSDEEIVAADDMLQTGDLLFNTRNSLDLVGKVAIWQDELPKAAYNSNLLRYKFDSSNVFSNYFMNHLFNSHYALSQLRGFAIGTTSVAAIYARDMKRFYVALPSLPEQKKIADILSKWDEGIEKIEELIDASKKLKKALCQQLLTGKKRFKEFGGNALNIDKLKKHLVECRGKNKQNNISTVLSVTNTRGFIEQSMQFSRVVASKDLTTYKIIKRGEFGYNPSRINVGSVDLLTSFETGILSPIYVIFKTKGSLTSEYLKHFLETHSFFEQMKHLTQGTVRDNLSFDSLCQIKMFIPEINEQQKIASVLNAADKEVELLNNKLEALKQQKKGLMQKLLTGKIRVKV